MRAAAIALAQIGGTTDAPLPEPSVLSVSSKVSCWLMAVPDRSSFQLMLFILGRSPFEALSASRGDSCGVRLCRVQPNPELTWCLPHLNLLSRPATKHCNPLPSLDLA